MARGVNGDLVTRLGLWPPFPPGDLDALIGHLMPNGFGTKLQTRPSRLELLCHKRLFLRRLWTGKLRIFSDFAVRSWRFACGENRVVSVLLRIVQVLDHPSLQHGGGLLR
jgi:hypothetical protein